MVNGARVIRVPILSIGLSRSGALFIPLVHAWPGVKPPHGRVGVGLSCLPVVSTRWSLLVAAQPYTMRAVSVSPRLYLSTLPGYAVHADC
jgi:hypothetical protein